MLIVWVGWAGVVAWLFDLGYVTEQTAAKIFSQSVCSHVCNSGV